MRLNEDIGSTGGPPARQCRVIVADSQPLVGAAMAALLAASGYDVMASVNDMAGIRAAVAADGCDILVVDIELFDPAMILGKPVVVAAPVSTHPGLAAAIGHGIAGLVLKSESADLLSLCLGRVAAGSQWFDSKALVEAAVQIEANKDAALLTRRERDVARLVAAGQRNRNIAAALGISEGTVKMHLHNVYTKLGLESRTQLAMDERLRNPVRLARSGSFGAPAGMYRRQRGEELVA